MEKGITEDEVFLYPVDIGAWASYEPYSNEEQLELQRENLVRAALSNGDGELRFIYTKRIASLSDYLDDAASKVMIEDAETVLETEVYYTSKIEGAKTTRVRTSEIHNGLPINEDNRKSELMVKNGFDAVKLLNLYGNRISKEILIRVWNVLVDGCCENEEIRGDEYRTGPVWVGSHEGVAFERIPELMDDWIRFYDSGTFDSKPFVKGALLHFAFETIHPFPDGNGRMGRLMMNNYLIGRGIDSARAVSFSMAIDGKRPLYDAAFVRAENRMNDCTPFLEYMLETMAEAYATALEVEKPSFGKTVKNWNAK